ncbi:MAG: glycosyltransferase [Oscillospiraceae bacterium]|nr:glycosyltransferase [Oscillospiraceae bacterium]
MEPYSVLMPVCYKEKAANLRLSIQSMLDQTVPPEQFVLVCDGLLTEELDAVVTEFAEADPALFTVVRMKKNRGIGVALNTGIRYCRNELVARMDADDISVSERMALQLAELEKYPDVSAVGGQIAEFCDEPTEITGYRKVPVAENEVGKYIRFRNPMNHVSVVLRKSHVLAVGNYQDVPGFEDYFLWASFIANGNTLRNVEQVCCVVRADSGMYSRRGGLRYFQNTMRIERFLLERKIISRWEFWCNVMIRFGGTVVLPPELRKLVFLCVLRKRKLQTQGKF